MIDVTPQTIVDIKSLTDPIESDWSNFVLAKNNNHVIRVSVMRRDFHWHSHEDSDETFLVLEGQLALDFEDYTVHLLPGQLITVPKGVIHRTRAKGRSVNLTFELANTNIEGDT